MADNAKHSASRGVLLKIVTEYEETAQLFHSRTRCDRECHQG
jgi:hypothetical protein